ncbi:MAG: SagB/ThcOx family dehydrogenase [Acidobacteriota bacterium]
MPRNRYRLCSLSLALLVGAFGAASTTVAQDQPEPIQLQRPAPRGGRPLLEALALRRSTRDFSERPLPEEVLARLLWAADGVNRPDGKRTAPSAWNRHTVEIYAVLESGAFRYVPDEDRLEPVVAGDLRALTGIQPFVATAPLNLVYVADLARLQDLEGSPDEKLLMAAVEAGHIAQNVYLFCASEGLGAVTRMLIDRERLAETLRLRPEQRIVSAQTVGYPVQNRE